MTPPFHWRDRPRITCVVPAYNYAAWIGLALDSALAQPLADQMEIVVVDDGSTDATAAVVAAYGERVRYVRKENGGLNSSVDRGLHEARGELVTLLDADDVWPADRLTPLVEVLDSHPEVGLVYGNMEVIDGSGRVIHRSFLESYGQDPIVGRGFGDLIRINTVSGGASMFRSSLSAAYRPIGPASAYPDWWLAVTISRVADLAFTPAVVNRYRWHGENMGLGRDDKALIALRDQEQPFRRWMLTSVKPGEAPTAKLIQAHRSYEALVMRVAERFGTPPGQVVAVDDSDRARAGAAFERAGSALARGDLDSALCGLVNSLAWDPWNAEVRARYEAAWQGYMVAAPSSGASAFDGARGFVTVAFADELVADPSLLATYAERFTDDDDATLIVWAPAWTPDEAITRLSAAVETAGAAGRELDADVLVEAGEDASAKRGALAERADAVLTRRPLPPFLAARPAFGPATATELRGLAESRWLGARV